MTVVLKLVCAEPSQKKPAPQPQTASKGQGAKKGAGPKGKPAGQKNIMSFFAKK